jgi:membrane protease YdiL (CAAX protease family)
MKKNPLLAFFLIAYVISWIFWIPALLSDYGVGLIHINPFITIPLLAIGILLGPGFAGWLMSGIPDGATGRKRWWQRFIQWRFHLFWYFFALFLPFFANLVADFTIITVKAPFLVASVLSSIPMNWLVVLTYLTLIPVQIAGSPLGEEPGWRGFALPRLQMSFGPLKGTLLLGFLWGMWHLPLILFSEDFRGPSPVVPYLIIFVVAIMAFSILLTLLFNVTRGSLLAVILAHAAYNTASQSVSQLLFTRGEDRSLLFPSALNFFTGYAAVFVLFAILSIIFTRGLLGYSLPKEYI